MTVAYSRQRMENQGACEAYARFHDQVPRWHDLSRYLCFLVIRNVLYWVIAIPLRNRTGVRSLSIQLRAAATRRQFKYVLRMLSDGEFRELVTKADWLSSAM